MVALTRVALHKVGVGADPLDKYAIALDLLFETRNLTVVLADLCIGAEGVADGEYRDIDRADGDNNRQHDPEIVNYL